ncbi:MAG: 1-acyl-sn-glycerol-3-phosphate acyltransferase [Lachnospiraceae bacterium]|nr:1-acyl-sn-glycerol-3-phosphate acyltransferase [Lachnospiraceae bacterium]MBR6474970.1 1-acyl-sn-glycerol-3-phosphate acyltransferase [Lachnospiraceae bacterium]
MVKPVIDIFYSFDDNFTKYVTVSLYSLIENASKNYDYHIHLLHQGLTDKSKELITSLGKPGFSFYFEDVTDYLSTLSRELPLRDYYSKTTYYRLFIADMHPELNKSLYIDSDTVIQGDISEVYNTDISDYYLAACHEQAMLNVDEFGNYVEQCVGVSRYNFFNCGVLLINTKEWRSHKVLNRFMSLLNQYDFLVTQDEDYLNLICKDHVLFLDQKWNYETMFELPCPENEVGVFHYIMFEKPWHYSNCPYADVYYSYAKKSPCYDEIMQELNSYSPDHITKDKECYEKLVALAEKEADNPDNYQNYLNKKKRASDRVAIVKKIREYELAKRFDEDVEDDPPSKVLNPEDIDYFRRSPIKKMLTKIAFGLARKKVKKLVKEKKLIIKEMRGMEHFRNLNSGAVITCNHFNAFDSFAIQLVYDAANKPKRTFYRIIREGNYTSFPGFYGFIMRNCNTLPLSSNYETMKKFMKSTNKLLQKGHFVLVYPEQSMWWNYRKPKPLKNGAYVFAAKNNVPVLPCFITMRDSDILDDDGYFIQEYTVHVSAPLYPDPSLPNKENVEKLREQNYKLWKDIYEKEYQMPLMY